MRCDIDSSDNIYVVGQYNGDSFMLVKYNSSGVIQWQKKLGTGFGILGMRMAVDSAGDICIAGKVSNDGLIAKYNSTGVLQWQRRLNVGSSDNTYGVDTDSSNNVYVTMYAFMPPYNIVTAKYNSSGVIQWQRQLSSGSGEDALDAAVDDSGNVYVTGRTGSGVFIAKYNTSGVIQWQRQLDGAGSELGLALGLDSAGNNVYVAGQTTSDGQGNDDILVAKYDSSGVIQWQRTIGGTNADRAYGIVHNGDEVYVTGLSYSAHQGQGDIFTIRIPNTMTLPETAGVITIDESTLTDSATSLTESAASGSDSAGSFTDSTITLTEGNGSLTVDVTNW